MLKINSVAETSRNTSYFQGSALVAGKPFLLSVGHFAKFSYFCSDLCPPADVLHHHLFA